MESFKNGIKAGIPIALGYYAVSFTFGIAAVKGGLSVFEAVMISVLNLTSAGQFAGIEVMFGAGTFVEMAVTQFIINLRYSLMSFSVSQKLGKGVPLWKRLIAAFGVTDEIFGVTAAQKGRVEPEFCFGAMAVAIPGWTLGTLTGAVSGAILPGAALSALGVAIYGMFIAIIVPEAKKNLRVLAVIISAMLLSSLFRYAPLLNEISEGFTIIIVTVLVAGVQAFLTVKAGDEDVS